MHESITYDIEPRSGDVEKGFASDADDDIHAVPDSGVATPISEKDTATLSIQLHRSHATQTTESLSLLSQAWKFLTYKSNALSDPDTSPPPDGGIRAWIVVVMCLMAGFNSFGLLNAYGVFQTYYVSMLHLPPSTISWIGSMQGFLLMFVSGPSGRLTDAGYFHQTLFIGTFLQLLGLFGASFATKYCQIMLSHGICAGIGGGLVFCPALSLVGTYFSKNRSLALAICAIGNSFGGLIFAGILESLLPKVGFAWSMRVVGFVVMSTMVPANFLLKPRRILRVKASLVDWSAFKEPVYATFLVGMFFTMLGMWVPVFYLGSFGRDIIRLPSTTAPSLLLVMNGVGVLGRVIPALVARRYGPLNLMIPLSLLSGLILFAWSGVHNQTEVIIFNVFYAFIMASGQGMFPPSLGSLTDDLSKMGVRMGMAFAACGIALLIGQPLAGVLIQAHGGGYLYAQIYSGATMTLGVVFLVAARTYRVGWRWNVIV